jgi:hypothetical protein
MEIPQSFYYIAASALLVLTAAGWLLAWWRQGDDASRLEPIMDATAEISPPFEENSVSVAAPAPPAMAAAAAEAQAMAAAPTANRAIEQGYRGFKIRLKEKQPGLWVALIADSASRSRKSGAEDRKFLVTPEYYQFPAALAEARTMIDRRLSAQR